jgi:hypothetical protein
MASATSDLRMMMRLKEFALSRYSVAIPYFNREAQ